MLSSTQHRLMPRARESLQQVHALSCWQVWMLGHLSLVHVQPQQATAMTLGSLI